MIYRDLHSYFRMNWKRLNVNFFNAKFNKIKNQILLLLDWLPHQS